MQNAMTRNRERVLGADDENNQPFQHEDQREFTSGPILPQVLTAELQHAGWRNGESRMFLSWAQEQRLRGWRGRGLHEGVQVFQYLCSIRGYSPGVAGTG